MWHSGQAVSEIRRAGGPLLRSKTARFSGKEPENRMDWRLERKAGFEPATHSLSGCCSTTELFPVCRKAADQRRYTIPQSGRTREVFEPRRCGDVQHKRKTPSTSIEGVLDLVKNDWLNLMHSWGRSQDRRAGCQTG